MKYLILKLLLIISILLTGCATLTAPQSYDPEKDPNNGLVIVSFDQSMHTIKWFYRNMKHKKAIKGVNEKFISTTDSINNLIYDGQSIIYPFKLEEGEYEFYWWTEPEAGHFYTATNDFSIKFKVTPGKATYIVNIFMYTVDDSYQIGIRDKSKKDIPLFLEKYTNVQENELISKLSTFEGFVDD